MNVSGGLFAMGLAQAIALLMSVLFVTYVAVIVVPYLRRRPRRPGDSRAFSWHLFIPARDEAVVLGDTVDYLLANFPGVHVWVIDDASYDRTGRIATAFADHDDQVHLVARCLPDARTGKGDALNAAYRALDRWLPAETDRGRVIVGVIDADGLPAANCFDVCAADHLFGDDRVGSVQVCVRMVNRDDAQPFPDRGRLANLFGRLLVRMQDLEFRAPISAIQMTRQRTRTVGLGGNGQFSRLSALDSVGGDDGRPWRGSLLEDYELSLHLLMAGHRNEYTMDTLVDQEGLPSMRRLLSQRTRWGQGTMQCNGYLRRIWTSPHVSTIGTLEASYYLIQPFLQLLGTLVYPVPYILLLFNLGASPGGLSGWLGDGGWLLVALYAVLGLGPFVIWGPIYARYCERSVGRWRGLGFGLAYAVFILSFYVTSWRAFIRILRGRRGWVKTRRNAESQPLPTPAQV